MRNLLGVLVICCVSCLQDYNTPELVVTDFLNASSVYNFSIASNYLVESDVEQYKSLQSFYDQIPDSTKLELPDQLQIPTIISSEIYDSSAIVVTSTLDSTSKKNQFDTFHLVIQDKMWKIKLK